MRRGASEACRLYAKFQEIEGRKLSLLWQEGRPGHLPCAGHWIALLCETVRAVRGPSSGMCDGSLEEVTSRLGVEG